MLVVALVLYRATIFKSFEDPLYLTTCHDPYNTFPAGDNSSTSHVDIMPFVDISCTLTPFFIYLYSLVPSILDMVLNSVLASLTQPAESHPSVLNVFEITHCVL